MKKLIISAIALTLISFANVQAGTVQHLNTVVTLSQEKVAVKPEDLPEAIKTTLGGDTYAGWQVTSAFLVTKEDNSQFYELSLKKGEETSTLNLDKDGKKVE
ncbi:hypothetical protein [Dyadobacter psychrotolerans]|uniref:Uncharacterized protein n=1 Tax=Dyadobacter psychrotolerans TaxID=2541721 RepID=A0A4R5DPP3_9BACT|nr:hypothetical protein [Dyadobacter psychrotolerans]TDE12743.1 hypothetical protein E0F88_20550 [Dyadobacter psychrotolerans]